MHTDPHPHASLLFLFFFYYTSFPLVSLSSLVSILVIHLAGCTSRTSFLYHHGFQPLGATIANCGIFASTSSKSHPQTATIWIHLSTVNACLPCEGPHVLHNTPLSFRSMNHHPDHFPLLLTTYPPESEMPHLASPHL